MSDTIYNPECTKLMDALRPLAAQVDVKSAHWICTPNGEYETHNGEREWCRDCGTFVVRHLRRRDRKHRQDYILDGGWPSEHETPIFCAHCGAKLECILLVSGGLYELEHFAENQPTPGNRNHAFELYEMLSAFEYVGPEHAEAAQEAIKIGRVFVEAGRP